MSIIRVNLEWRSGEIIVTSDTGSLHILDSLLPVGDPSFPMVTSIDPYGVTLFSSYQMNWFLDEWLAISSATWPEREKQYWAHIKELGERCKMTPHSFLVFHGD
jgi:hypothetical protein